MDSFVPNSDRDPAVEAQAAAWVSLRDGAMTAEQESRFDQWMEDPDCATAFFRLEGTWRSMDKLSALKKADLSLDPDFNPQAETKTDRQRVWLVLAAMGAAAAVILWLAPRSGRIGALSAEMQSAATKVGEMRDLTLSDGSVVQLNTDTAVKVDYTLGERRVRLEHGEAHFAVAKNAERPFIVAAGNVAVRAVGTAFDVRIRPDSVEVLVTEGKVRVDDAQKGNSLLSPWPASDTPLLIAGERVLIPTGSSSESETKPSTPSQDDIAREMSWQKGVLNFRSTPLSEIVAEFNRYNTHKLVITDPEIGSLRIGVLGVRPTDYEGFVRTLENNYGVRATPATDSTLLDRAK